MIPDEFRHKQLIEYAFGRHFYPKPHALKVYVYQFLLSLGIGPTTFAMLYHFNYRTALIVMFGYRVKISYFVFQRELKVIQLWYNMRINMMVLLSIPPSSLIANVPSVVAYPYLCLSRHTLTF